MHLQRFDQVRAKEIICLKLSTKRGLVDVSPSPELDILFFSQQYPCSHNRLISNSLTILTQILTSLTHTAPCSRPRFLSLSLGVLTHPTIDAVQVKMRRNYPEYQYCIKNKSFSIAACFGMNTAHRNPFRRSDETNDQGSRQPKAQIVSQSDVRT